MMKPARTALACVAAFCVSASLFAFEWPLDQPAVSATFGTVSKGHFLPGMEIRSEQADVLAVAKGEVIFVEDGKGPGAFSSGLGSCVALYHERDLVSIYGKIKEGTSVDYLKDARQGDILGLAGQSGGASRLEFLLYDAVKRQFVNPCLFLSVLPDKYAPSIKAVYLKRDATPFNLQDSRSMRQGLCEVQAEFWDPSPDAASKSLNAPFAVRVLLNGSEKINLKWDTGSERDGLFRMFSGDGMDAKSFSASPGRFRLGAFSIPRGRMNLEIIVSDFSQNERSASFMLQAE